MIPGFEIETTPLNDYEMNTLLPLMVRNLARKIGKQNAVKNGYICNRLQALGYDINEARVRKLISHIRTKGLVPRLIATSAGYYVSNNQAEIDDYIESLKGREMAIKAVREAMEQQRIINL